MLIIDHRVNTAEHLAKVDSGRGVEIDIRDYDGDLRLEHDPFKSGERLGDWLRGYRHAFCIFNVKCDGLEEGILNLAAEHKVGSFFFLDCALPTLVKLARRGETRLAVRYSEFEPLEFALAFAGKAEWVWVDCFTRLPLDSSAYSRLKKNFKICLVSPELQGHGRGSIARTRQTLREGGMEMDAVCTDYPADWT